MIMYNVKVGKFMYRKGIEFEAAEMIKKNLDHCVRNVLIEAERAV